MAKHRAPECLVKLANQTNSTEQEIERKKSPSSCASDLDFAWKLPLLPLFFSSWKIAAAWSQETGRFVCTARAGAGTNGRDVSLLPIWTVGAYQRKGLVLAASFFWLLEWAD